MSAPVVDSQAVPDPATTHWVPVGPGPLPDFRYRGDFVAATSYADGDIVVYGGVAYLCVLPTSSAPIAWAPPTISPSYGTTLPASPVDGQEHVLVDSVTAPTYQWRFRYNAASTSPYKWEFVGGPKWIYGPVSLPNALSSTTYAAMPGAPSMVVPRSGVYIADLGTFTYMAGTGAHAGGGCSLAGAGLTADDSTSVSYTLTGISGNYVGDTGAASFRVTLTGGGTLTVWGKASYGGAVQVTQMTLTILPVRVA